MKSALGAILATESGKYIVLHTLRSPYAWIGLLIGFCIATWLIIKLPSQLEWLSNILMYLVAGCIATLIFVGMIYVLMVYFFKVEW